MRLHAALPALESPAGLRYQTRTGAILRLDGAIAGAFDREHDVVAVAPGPQREVTLEVELAALPTHGLPSRPGARWKWMTRTAAQRPSAKLEIVDAPPISEGPATGDLPLIAHAHLDLAWLWTFAEGRRKALRTLANALAIASREPGYVFVQSQPALFAGVEEDDRALFARIKEAVAAGNIDVSVAAPWVETDCNIPSGETLLRQCAYGMNAMERWFGIVPSIAWLPDTFGFPNTLPQLLTHAGVRFFLTAKLEWNDTTRWPHPQFLWRGPDGSAVLGAVVASYDGRATPERIARAQERNEPLIVGYGDGGGGPNDEIVASARAIGHWSGPRAWFEKRAADSEHLPRVDGELYLEYHRGVWTTHHDVKARRFALEGALDEAEELVAWCIAVRASRNLTEPLAADLRNAWPPLLRGDFHDVVCGTAIAPAYGELFEDYDKVERIASRVREAAYSILPRAQLPRDEDEEAPPREDDDGFVLENDLVFARFRHDGTMTELRRTNGPNVVTGANVLRAYVDKPREWEAWNIDPSYARHPVRIRPEAVEVDEGALIARYRLRGSRIVLRIALGKNDPFVRVAAAVIWNERRTILRLENWLALDARTATFGTPHGTLDRTTVVETDAERAKFEVPGQRFARVDAPSGGFALLATDNYGWNARSLRDGGIQLGLSLLRSPCWPDPDADRGEHRLAWALLPLPAGSGIGALEQLWRAYAYPARVRLLTCDEPAVLVTACKPADDGDGIVVRVRECEGAQRRMRLNFGGRPRTIESCDARERKIEREVAIEDGTIVASLEPYELRSFHIRL
ncbi:MAG: alpha-mannosidase [Vulcanimicrobiaceae bacterium]